MSFCMDNTVHNVLVCLFLFSCLCGEKGVIVIVTKDVWLFNQIKLSLLTMILLLAVTKLGEATMALGRQVAPHIRKKGEELLPKSMKTQKSKSTMDGIMEVAASGLHGNADSLFLFLHSLTVLQY